MPDARDELDWMVRTQLEPRGIFDARVLEAMRTIDRRRFVPEAHGSLAYDDNPLPIGEGQTISQPYMVAVMTQSLDLRGPQRILEIGTGSGYQTAVLARLGGEVYTVECRPALLEKARAVLDSMGFKNVHYRAGDGRRGWPEASPFDRILCAAAAADVPQAWLDQLADGGILLVPVGGAEGQVLVKVANRGGRLVRTEFCPCRFVPLVGEGDDACS
ncbi:MAG: protein-L-isoaspartate(D-aspartate) O-methyltransferase [Planctomycetes bacterium]|nr:protein-L-isoaspartate(D-aspartate) O-methyltransferase [Planctomycetota bacterium]